MSREPVRLAIVEDDPVMGESLVQRLTLEGYAVAWWRCGRQAASELAERPPHAVICDIRLPDISGDELFRAVSARAKGAGTPPFLFITGYGEIDQAVALMRSGAADYVAKPFAMDDFLRRIEALVERCPAASPATGELGPSPAMRAVERLLVRVADLDSTVLLTGETGVGKEVCARFLHATSANSDAPFVAVNCAAIPTELMESELFGHEKGAFTGAIARHVGYAERAANGVLFLDEVGDLPAGLQGKLLRLIQERTFHRVGGEVAVPFAARLVCSTNRDLETAVSERSFRADLFYRINVIPVQVPALRDRREDIVPLLHHYARHFAALMGREIAGVGALAEEAAWHHSWPGNVRELCNRVERAVALARGEWLGPGDLFPEWGDAPAEGEPGTLAAARQAAERRQILRALDETGGRIARAAERLGVSRTTLWEKMKRHRIEGAA